MIRIRILLIHIKLQLLKILSLHDLRVTLEEPTYQMFLIILLKLRKTSSQEKWTQLTEPGRKSKFMPIIQYRNLEILKLRWEGASQSLDKRNYKLDQFPKKVRKEYRMETKMKGYIKTKVRISKAIR